MVMAFMKPLLGNAVTFSLRIRSSSIRLCSFSASIRSSSACRPIKLFLSMELPPLNATLVLLVLLELVTTTFSTIFWLGFEATTDGALLFSTANSSTLSDLALTFTLSLPFMISSLSAANLWIQRTTYLAIYVSAVGYLRGIKRTACSSEM